MNVAEKQHLYIYPPRAQLVVPRDKADIFAKRGWKAQLKFNDSRCLIKAIWTDDGWDIQLWSRHSDLLKYDLSASLRDEIIQVLDMLGCEKAGWHLLDGGLLHSKHAAIKNTIVIWDILVHNSEWLLGRTYQDRYSILHLGCSIEDWTFSGHPFGKKFTDHIFMPINWESDNWDIVWRMVEQVNEPHTANGDIKPVLEGLVYKDMEGKLEIGLSENNNDSWMARSRVKTGRHEF